MEKSGTGRKTPQNNPVVTFSIEIHPLTMQQKEAGKRIVKRLVLIAQSRYKDSLP